MPVVVHSALAQEKTTPAFWVAAFFTHSPLNLIILIRTRRVIGMTYDFFFFAHNDPLENETRVGQLARVLWLWVSWLMYILLTKKVRCQKHFDAFIHSPFH